MPRPRGSNYFAGCSLAQKESVNHIRHHTIHVHGIRQHSIAAGSERLADHEMLSIMTGCFAPGAAGEAWAVR
jgi:hypothetical protein